MRQINDAITIQIKEQNTEAFSLETKILKGLPHSINNLSGKITQFAIRTCHSLHLSKEKSTECLNCSFSKYMGIPCVHKIKEYELKGKQFEVEDFHDQWHFKTNLVSFFI